MHLSLFDIIISAIFLGSTIIGLYRGFTVSMLGIAAFLLTIFFTFILFPFSKDIIKEHVSNELTINIFSIAISYSISKIACSWCFKLTKEIVEKFSGGIIDRSFGAWLGAARGFIFCLIAFISIGIITSGSYIGAKNYWQIFKNINEDEYPKWLQKSYSYFLMQNSYITTKNFLEDSMISKSLESIVIMSENNVSKDNIQNINQPNLEGGTNDSTDSLKQKVQDHVIEKLQEELNKQTLPIKPEE